MVSIVVPSYNYENYLEQRLNSIISQSFQDYEIIVIDDLSTDNSLEIIENYLNHPFVNLLRNDIYQISIYF